ncbi:MAG TPA: ABC transporter permease, partial [Candidatus Acidoferrales bacterium]
METFWQDVRFAARALLKNPAFAAVAILTLALGIGANTAIFSVVNGVLLRPLPYPDPGRLTMVWMDNPRMNVHDDITSYPNYQDWRDRNRSFEQMAAYTGYGAAFNLTGFDEPERLRGAQVTSNFFTVLGVQPALGSLFTKENEVPGKDLVIVLSHGFWQRKYGGRADVVGQSIQLSGNTYTIVGVMPAGFQFPRGTELWKPLAPGDDLRQSRGSFWLPVIGRLKPGIELSQAQADVNAVAAALEKEYPGNAGFGINLVPLHRQIVGETRTVLLVLLAAVGFILLIACANVANLMLARAAGREREMAIRAALGAGRARLVRQMLTESVLLSVVSGVLGLLAAVWVTDLFVSLAPGGLPRAEAIGLDGSVLVFTTVVALSTGVIFGLLPAVGVSRQKGLGESLKETGRSSAGRVRNRMRSSLVVAEVALSLVLLVGAGLAMQSFWRMQQVERGFDTSSTLTMMLSLAPQKYPQPEQVAAFYQQLLERVRAVPGVESAAATTDVFMADLPNSAS